MYFIFVFSFSQIQDARNCSTQSVYVFCSNRMMRKFALYKGACCCKQLVGGFSVLVCYKEVSSVKTEDKYLRTEKPNVSVGYNKKAKLW